MNPGVHFELDSRTNRCCCDARLRAANCSVACGDLALHFSNRMAARRASIELAIAGTSLHDSLAKRCGRLKVCR